MSKALVILSGGMDSTVLLHHVAHELDYKEVYAITFNYGQRIAREIECAKFQAKDCSVNEHKIVNMDFFRDISKMSALTNIDLKIPKAREDIGNAQPLSYVPFRNLLLLTTAAGWAESIGAEHLARINTAGSVGTGGAGGGGNGSKTTGGNAATANTGSGGGGGADDIPGVGNGGSGIVIVRYPSAFANASATTGSPSFYNSGGYKYYKYNASGSITF